MEDLFRDLYGKEENLFTAGVKKPKPITVEQVLSVVCTQSGINPIYIKEIKLRERKITWTKTIIAYILRWNLHMRVTDIAKLFGLSDHSTVSYRVRRAEKLMSNPTFRTLYTKCMRELYREGNPYAHDISTYMYRNYNARMPENFIYELNRIEQWVAKYGYKMALKKVEIKEDV